MWVSKREFALFEEWKGAAAEHQHLYYEQRAQNLEQAALITELRVRLQQQETLNEWFRHRLNQVEQERAQLIYAATGGKEPIPEQVKINVPNFQGRPTTPMQGWASLTERLNESFNPYEGVGEDSHDPADQAPVATEDVSNMPRSR